jgi:hypothetical protein
MRPLLMAFDSKSLNVVIPVVKQIKRVPVVELETLRRVVVPYGIAVFLASIAVFDIRASN